MKKINKLLSYIGCLALGFAMNSCNDITSENNTTTASFNTYEELVQGRLPSIYASLRSNALYRQGGLLGTWSDVGVDTHTATGFPEELVPLYTYSYSAGTLAIEETWTEFYTAVKQINTFLGQIDTFSVTGPERDEVVAEARFLRALLYFDMVKIWGNIPLVVSQDITLSQIRDDSLLPNATAEEVYLQIIEDLEYAKMNGASRVGSTADIASSEAAQTLLGKVYLQMTTTKEYGGVEGGIDDEGNSVSVIKRFEQARDELRVIIESNKFELESNYGDIFSNENNNEVIFSVGFDGPNNDVGGDFGDFLGEGDNRDGGGFGSSRISVQFALEYLEGDVLIDSTREAIEPGVNLLPPVETSLFDVSASNFNAEVRLLGPDNFISDTRFTQNVSRLNILEEARRLRGDAQATVQQIFDNKNRPWGNWFPLKYRKPIPNPNNSGDGDIDFPFLRYADVLLMQAEALNALGDQAAAAELVNQVVGRAIKDKVLKSIPSGVLFSTPIDNTPQMPSQTDINNIVTTSLVDTDLSKFTVDPGLDQEAMLRAIVKERGKELAFEGKRKDDLIRTGLLQEVVNSFHANTHPDQSFQNFVTVQSGFQLERHTHWPIPQNQLILNPNLQQNCLYGAGSATGGCF